MARKRKQVARLSAGELEVLEMLWRDGPVTIVEAQRALALDIGYTTVQTRLNRLVAKGIARRTKERPARYEAAVTREAVTAGDLALLVDKVSCGRVVPLVAYLVRDRALTAAEIAELKALIAEAAKNSPRISQRSAERRT